MMFIFRFLQIVLATTCIGQIQAFRPSKSYPCRIDNAQLFIATQGMLCLWLLWFYQKSGKHCFERIGWRTTTSPLSPILCILSPWSLTVFHKIFHARTPVRIYEILIHYSHLLQSSFYPSLKKGIHLFNPIREFKICVHFFFLDDFPKNNVSWIFWSITRLTPLFDTISPLKRKTHRTSFGSKWWNGFRIKITRLEGMGGGCGRSSITCGWLTCLLVLSTKLALMVDQCKELKMGFCILFTQIGIIYYCVYASTVLS